VVKITARLGPENDCAGEAQKYLYITEPSYRQRGRPSSTNQQLTEDNEKRIEKLVTGRRSVPETRELVTGRRSVPETRETGRLTVGRNIAWTSLSACVRSALRFNDREAVAIGHSPACACNRSGDLQWRAPCQILH
jgi:hypothetical protein